VVRFWLIIGFVALIFWVYTIVDCAVQPATRHRAVSKPAWIAIVVLLPVLGGVLWLAIGRTRPSTVASRRAPDDDPEFLGRLGSMSDQDERIRRLEEELAQLDAEADDPRWTTPEPSLPTSADSAAKPEPPVRDPDRPDGDDDVRGQRGAVS
jgi:hypothetical protein